MEQDRAQVEQLAEAVQEVTRETVEVAFVDQVYTCYTAAEEAAAHSIRLEVVKLDEAKKGFVLLTRRWVWSVASGGRRDSGDWHEIMSDCRRRWPDCISWHLLS